jgi:5-(carboxyamino)imidazole ribonucleotide mutase
MGVNGSRNAGLLAVRILAVGDSALTAQLETFQAETAAAARAQDADVVARSEKREEGDD